MWFLTDASAAQTRVIVAARSPKYFDAPPDSSAHDPSGGLTTPPIRPKATTVPTPVARMEVGKTCAARAYIVVCVALMSPPVHANIAKTVTLDCGAMDITDNPAAPTMAPAPIASIDSRDPSRMMTTAPVIAPTTPPKSNAVRP